MIWAVHFRGYWYESTPRQAAYHATRGREVRLMSHDEFRMLDGQQMRRGGAA